MFSFILDVNSYPDEKCFFLYAHATEELGSYILIGMEEWLKNPSEQKEQSSTWQMCQKLYRQVQEGLGSCNTPEKSNSHYSENQCLFQQQQQQQRD